MHLVRGMSSLNTKRRKANKQPGWQKAQAEHDAWLKKMGVHPSQLKNKEKSSGNSVPDYSSTRPTIKTSDRICAIAPKACLLYTSDAADDA